MSHIRRVLLAATSLLLLVLIAPALPVSAEDQVSTSDSEVQSEQLAPESSTTPDIPPVTSTDEIATPPEEEASTTPPTPPEWFLHDHPWGSGSSTDASSTPSWFSHLFDFSNWFHHGDEGDATTTTTNNMPLLHAPIMHQKATPPGGKNSRSGHERVSGEVITVRNSSVVITAGGHASVGLARGESRPEKTVTVELPTGDPTARPRTISVGQRLLAYGTSDGNGAFIASSVRIISDAAPLGTTTPSQRSWTRPVRQTTARHGR